MLRAIATGLLAVFTGTALVSAPARAQQSPFSLTSRRAAPVEVNPGAALTLVATASNRSAAEASATPSITVPDGWQVVTGESRFALGAGEAEALIISVSVPAATAAGSYMVGLSVDFAGAAVRATASDSVTVIVREHRSIALALVRKPAYALAGDSYEASFRVVNRGNSVALAVVTGRSSLGRVHGSDTLDIEPGASRDVVVRVKLRDLSGNTADEVLEVRATHASDSTVSSEAAARVAVVPRSGRLDGYSTVASTLRLRAAPAQGGIAPFTLIGGGSLSDDGSKQITFSANGRSRGASRFGERESYRLEISSNNGRLRAGDNLYTMSPLTGSGQPGVGAAIERTVGMFTAGAFGQRFRSAPELGTEFGAFTSVQAPGASRAKMTLNFVDRSARQFEGRVGSSEVSFRPFGETLVNAEYAMTDNRAAAYNARLSGRIGRATIDFGHHRADSAFGGPQRGSSHDYLDVNTSLTKNVRLAAFATRSSTMAATTDSAEANAFSNTGVSATINDRFTVELSELDRSLGPVRATQRSVRVRSALSFGSFSVTGDAKVGMTRDVATQQTGSLHQLSLAPRLRIGRHTMGAYVSVSDATNPANRGALSEAVTTTGLDVSTRFGATEIGISGFGTHIRSNGWTTQTDLRVTQALSAGITMSARAHLVSGRNATSGEKSLVYLDFGVPLRLPVFPRGGPGRVLGRVSDAATGRPVSNALVRVGSRVAVTNRDGKVSMTDVAPGEHRVTLGDDTTLSAAVLVGAMTIVVDSTKSAPARFNVAVARGAGVRTEIRRMARARTTIDSTQADSLVDDGPMSNMLVALISRRDTLYQTTDAKGKVSFTDVAPGEWVVAVVTADVPASHAFDRQSYDLSLEPGQVVSKAFLLLPRRRAVQMIASTEMDAAPVAMTAAKQR